MLSLLFIHYSTALPFLPTTSPHSRHLPPPPVIPTPIDLPAPNSHHPSPSTNFHLQHPGSYISSLSAPVTPTLSTSPALTQPVVTSTLHHHHHQFAFLTTRHHQHPPLPLIPTTLILSRLHLITSHPSHTQLSNSPFLTFTCPNFYTLCSKHSSA